MVTSRRIVIVLEQNVSERNQYAQERMFESIDAGMRFVVLGDIILKTIGTYPENSNANTAPTIAVWPHSNSGYHFKLHKSMRLTGPYPMICVCLEHYIDSLPAEQPLTRYAVLYNPYMVSDIKIIDSEYNPIESDSRQGKEAAKEALKVLSEQAGDQAVLLLHTIFEKRFEEIVGRYVLSDLAVKKEGEALAQIDMNAVTESLVTHMNNEIQLYEEEGNKSSAHDSTSKQVIVADAIHEPPHSNRHGRFVNVDIIQSTKIAQRTIGIIWNNTISAEGLNN